MTATPPAARLAESPDADRVRSHLMQASLGALLDQVRGSREVLPHLAALEVSLGKRGIAAIEGMPPRLLTRICSQLSSLPVPENDAPLLDLLTRLIDAMGPPARPPTRPSQAPAPVIDDSKLMVTEISHSDYMRATFEQATTQTGDP